jgi:hypothetical protein
MTMTLNYDREALDDDLFRLYAAYADRYGREQARNLLHGIGVLAVDLNAGEGRYDDRPDNHAWTLDPVSFARWLLPEVSSALLQTRRWEKAHRTTLDYRVTAIAHTLGRARTHLEYLAGYKQDPRYGDIGTAGKPAES